MNIAFDFHELERQRYRGMNPSFVRKVWAKRRETAADAPPEATKRDKHAQQMMEWQKRRIDKLAAQIGAGGVKGVIAEVAMKHGLTIDDILGSSRVKGIVAARHEAIQEVARVRPSMSLPQLGRIFNRDHTTCLYILNKGKSAKG